MPEEAMYIPFPQDPEEVKRHVDRAQMALTAIRHGIDAMIDNMSKDDLLSFKILMGQVGDHDNSKLAVHFEGQATYALKSKFRVCPGCGVDHDEAMRDEMEKEFKRDNTSGRVIQKPSSDDLIKHILESDRLDPKWISDNLVGYQPSGPPFSDLERSMMALYGLDDLHEESSENGYTEFIGFICKNCKMRYSSIQDRMLRGADECRGCHLKAAHG